MGRSRVNELDLLRFAAALSVVLFHYAFRGYAADNLSAMPYQALAPVAKYAYLGVQLFFLISGFVILMTASAGGLRNFVISRAVRLYPAFWVCCTLTFAAIVLFGGDRHHATFAQYLANMTLLSGFAGVPSIDGVYWSLFVELRFYGLVALLLALGGIRRAEGWIVAWLLAVLALSLFPAPRIATLLIADYAAYFIGGATAYLIWSKGMTLLRLWTYIACWILALCNAAIELPLLEEHYRTDMSVTGVAAIVTVVFVVMLLVATRSTGAIGRANWIVVGALTYPLYLLHENVGYIVFNAAWPAIDAHLLFWTTLLLMLAAAWAVHVLVERRFAAPMKALLQRALDNLPFRTGPLRAIALENMAMKEKASR